MDDIRAGEASVAKRDLQQRLIDLGNAQYVSDGFKRLLAARFTMAGARDYFLQHAHFNVNRRDVWGFVQGAAPLPVKKMVWDHETDELAGDAKRGVPDHFTLVIKQGAAFGLTADDFRDAPQLDVTFACTQAWLNIARTSPWLEAFASASCLEITNSDTLIRGGCLSRRIAEKCRDELGIPLSRQHSNAEHITADVEHGALLLKLVDLYGDSDDARAKILSGATKSWTIERVFRGFTGTLIERHAA